MVGVAALGGIVKREAEEDWGPPGAVDNMPGSPTNYLNFSALPQSGTVVINRGIGENVGV
jgi:hypothetical protein